MSVYFCLPQLHFGISQCPCNVLVDFQWPDWNFLLIPSFQSSSCLFHSVGNNIHTLASSLLVPKKKKKNWWLETPDRNLKIMCMKNWLSLNHDHIWPHPLQQIFDWISACYGSDQVISVLLLINSRVTCECESLKKCIDWVIKFLLFVKW